MKKSEPEHLIIQLRKIVNIGSAREVEFVGNKFVTVEPSTASQILFKYNEMSLPADRENFQSFINHPERLLFWASFIPGSISPVSKEWTGVKREDISKIIKPKARARASRKLAIKKQIVRLFQEV